MPGPTTSGGLAPPAGTMLSAESFAAASACAAAAIQGLTLFYFSAPPDSFLALNKSPKRLNTPSEPALNSPQTPPKYPLSHPKRLR